MSDVRNTLSKHGGSLGESGSVKWNFEQKGVIRLSLDAIDREAVELGAIDAGADDTKAEDGALVITTSPKNTQRLKEALEAKGISIEYAGIEFIAKNTVDITEDQKQKLETLTDALDELEDVNDYYTNEA